MFAWLLAPTLALATPPPQAAEGPPRIRGLAQLYVTPEAFVSGLRPEAAAAPAATPRPVYDVTLRTDSPVSAEQIVAHALTVDGLHAEVAEGGVRLRSEHGEIDPEAFEIPLGDEAYRLASLGEVVASPVPTPSRMPGPARVGPTVGPVPTLAPTGYDLRIHSPIVGMRVELEVEGTVIGELAPYQLAVLRDVRPGTYDVVLITPTGHREVLEVVAEKRPPPSAGKKKKKK